MSDLDGVLDEVQGTIGRFGQSLVDRLIAQGDLRAAEELANGIFDLGENFRELSAAQENPIKWEITARVAAGDIEGANAVSEALDRLVEVYGDVSDLPPEQLHEMVMRIVGETENAAEGDPTLLGFLEDYQVRLGLLPTEVQSQIIAIADEQGLDVAERALDDLQADRETVFTALLDGASKAETEAALAELARERRAGLTIDLLVSDDDLKLASALIGGTGGITARPAARGGITTGETLLVGEGSKAYPEYVIPTDPGEARTAIPLFYDLARQLGLATESPMAAPPPALPVAVPAGVSSSEGGGTTVKNELTLVGHDYTLDQAWDMMLDRLGEKTTSRTDR